VQSVRALVVVSLGASVAVSSGALADPGFAGIGDLAGGAFLSEAFGISQDGTQVVGYAATGVNQTRAVLWSAGTLTGLADPAGTYTPRVAYSMVNRGVIVGEAQGPNGVEAFKYNTQGGQRFRAIGGTTPGGFFGGAAYDVDASGSVTVGTRENPGFALEAARWDGPTISGLGYLVASGGFLSEAYAISLDGTTIVGQSDADNGAVAFAAVDGNPMQALGLLPNSTESAANGVNDDGSVIVGFSTIPGATAATIWLSGSPETLADLPGGFNFASAAACDDAGDTVVGRASGDNGIEAVVWRAGTVQTIRQVLLDAGVNSVASWTLTAAYGISSDGLVVCGTGINPSGNTEGWVATLPAQGGNCPADFNGDGFLDFFDYDDFVACFEGSGTPGCDADFNGDGFVDFFDYDDFVGAFEQGCN
jgi:probable HAF family extracellular repeat protein